MESEIMEAVERLQVVTELLVALRPVLEVVPMDRVGRPVRMELQVELKILLDVTEETEHLPALMARLALVRIGLVDLLQPRMELLAVDKEGFEELLVAVRVLQTLMEFLVPVRPVLEELKVLVKVVLVDHLQPVTELLAAARVVLADLMVAVVVVLADLLQANMELLTAVTVTLVDLLQVLTEHQGADKEVLLEGVVTVRVVPGDLLLVLTELQVVDGEVLDRLAVKHPPTFTEHLLVVRMVCMVEIGHLQELTVHQMAEATVSGLEAEGVLTGLSPQLGRVQVADMEVELAMTDPL
jgi:hypothetical protein